MQVLGANGMGGVPQDIVRGANGMLGGSALQDTSWPYWWVIPRATTKPVPFVKSIAAPAATVLTEVLSLTVPSETCFVLKGIRHSYQGTGFVDGSGDILWTIDVDSPIGAIALNGAPVAFMSNMADMRGDQTAYWPVEGFCVFWPYQTIRYKVIMTNVPGSGAPNYVTCGLFGWFDKAV